MSSAGLNATHPTRALRHYRVRLLHRLLLYQTWGCILSVGVCSGTPLQAVRWLWCDGIADGCDHGVFERPADLVHTPWHGVTLAGNFEDVYRREDRRIRTAVRSWNTQVGCTVPVPCAPTGILSLEGRTSDFRGRVPTDGDRTVTDVLDGRTLGGLQYAQGVGRHLAIGLGLRALAGASAPVLDMSLHAVLRTPRVSADLRSIGESWQPSVTVLDSEDTIEIACPARAMRHAVSVGVNPSRALAIRIEGEGAQARPDNSVGGYVGRVSAVWRAGGIRVRSEATDRLSIDAGIRQGHLGGKLSGRLDGEEFSRGILSVSGRSGFLGITWSGSQAFSAELRGFGAHATGTLGKGVFESWPFVPAFHSLFLGRDWLVKGDGDLRIHGCGVKTACLVGRRLEMRTVADLVHLNPRLDVWTQERRKFDVIGLFFPDTERRTLSIRGVDALDLGIRPSLRLSAICIGYTFAQFFPLRVERTPGMAGVPGERAKTRGGRSHTIVVSYPGGLPEGGVRP